MSHKTVLLHEAVDGLNFESGATIVDATFGSGGHAAEILHRLDGTGTYVGIDADETALVGKVFPETKTNIHLVNENFENIEQILRSLHIEKVDGILADLGWRMEQFTDGGKGFSFNVDEPLHMTFGDPKKYAFTAHDIVNDWDEETLANIFYGYAQERFARRIARKIVEVRNDSVINTTKELVAVIESAVPKSHLHKKTHAATKAFQALRIAVNDEFGVLERFIAAAIRSLKSDGRLAIISFHSLEDRIVKQTFRSLAAADTGLIITKKPIAPTPEEMKENPRARSAKLRIIQKV